MRSVRIAAPLCLVIAAAACGLLAPPGGYADDGEIIDAATPPNGDGPSTNDGASPPDDGAIPPSSAGTIIVVAGERDPTSAADNPAWTSDVWAGVLDADGHVVRWQVQPSALIAGPYDAASVIGGGLFTLSYGLGIGGGRGDALSSVAWSPGPTGAWRAAGVGMPGGLEDRARVFFGSHVVTVGGVRFVPVDGGTATVYTKEVHTADIDTAMNTLGTFGDPGVSLVNARSRAGAAVASGFLYVVGGRTGSGFTGSVEVAKVDVTAGTIAAFAAQPVLTAAGAEHKVYTPAVAGGGGFLFVAGGRLTFAATATDVVVIAKMGADGSLSDIKNGPALPTAVRDLGLVVLGSKLYAIGGQAAANRIADVWSSTIAADGSLGPWETTNAKLPAPRSELVAIAYEGPPP